MTYMPNLFIRLYYPCKSRREQKRELLAKFNGMCKINFTDKKKR